MKLWFIPGSYEIMSARCPMKAIQRMNSKAFVLLFSVLFHSATAFVLPGVAPFDYKKGDDVEIKAVKLTSEKAQLPYEYYSLPFCKPSGTLEYKTENLGKFYCHKSDILAINFASLVTLVLDKVVPVLLKLGGSTKYPRPKSQNTEAQSLKIPKSRNTRVWNNIWI